MDLLCAIAGKILEFTVEPIGRQLGYLISYHSNLQMLQDEFKDLQNERDVVQHKVDAALRNGEEIEVKVQDWFSKVDETTKMAENFFGEESQANTRCSYKSCPKLWSRHQISRKAKKMTQEVLKIKGKGKFDGVSSYVPPQMVGLPSTSSSTMNEGMDSRISIMDEILKALVDPNVNMIGLCGLPGVGKTTLAKEVARKAKEQNLFDMVVMVIVAQNPNLKEIQTQIAENVGMKLDADSLNARASHLENRLKKEKNLLMVLDDLWERLDLAQVGIPFDYDGKKKDLLVNENDGKNNCCKILLTSRNKELLSNQMNCKKNIKVGVLSEKEAWELFKGKAELHDDSVYLNLAAEVAQQCAGLPLAIVTVAGALRNKELSEWKDALRRLKKPLRRNITGIEEVDSSLKLSYDHLKGDDRQSIFLLSAMLSHDPLIIDLLMYSVGLSVLQEVHSMKDAQDAIDVLVSKLKNSSLLLDSSSNDRFTMHDVVREFALSIASREQHALVVRHEKQYELPRKTLLEGYTRMCLYKCDVCELPEEFCCPRLEFFLLDSLDSSLRIPSTFFKSMNELKVMGLTNMHFSSLPSSLGILEKLSTLCLHSCILEDIAEVGKLRYLKVLSLAYSKIKRLPCELAQLSCLQMLNLAHCTKLEAIPPNVLSSLERLEILYMVNSFNKWQDKASKEGNQNVSLGELRHLQMLSSLEVHIPDASVLPKELFLENSLERYKIFIGEDWYWGGSYETSKTLKLKLESGIQSELGIQKLLERAEDLYLGEVNGITNVVYDLDGRGFPHLKHLHIQNNDQIEYVVVNTKRLVGAFPNLETLDLSNLNGLKKLCHGRITAAFFQNLKVIEVQICDDLESIFSISMTGLFRHLERVVIWRCKSMKEIVSSATQDSFDEQKSAANVIIFAQLRYLEISDLPALTTFYFEDNATDRESIKISKSLFKNKVSFPKLEKLLLISINSLIISVWDDRLPQNSFRNLKSFIVKNCGFVKLVPFHVLKSLSNLAKLEIYRCQLLETVFDLEELNRYKETKSLLVVPLKELTLQGLPKLKTVWSNDTKGMVSFQNLQKVSASDCESLTSVFPASIAKGMLHLEELQIPNCGIDVIVAKDESGATTSMFPRLTSLSIQILPNMRNFYPQGHTSEWPFLQKLKIWDCDKLEIFENEISSLSTIQEEEAPDLKYPLFFHEKVIPNLEHLILQGKYADVIWNGQSPFYFRKVKKLCLRIASPNNTAAFLYGLLKKFPNLEQLQLSGSMGEIVFPCMEPLGDVVAPFSELLLNDVNEVKHIWNQHSQPHILQNLESLDVKECIGFINLGPCFISLGNLIEIKVHSCHRMINLLTSQTARSLVQLKRLEISNCSRIEEIITKQREDVEKEIVSKKLEYLELHRLPTLKRFCNHSYNFMFPLLGQVIIRECPKLSMFCSGNTQTPSLKGVKVTKNDMLWETNLNRTIQLWYPQQIEYLKLDEHPDMKNIWDGKPPHHLSFSKLISLVVDNCDFLFEYVIPAHLVRFLSSLKELEVRNCHSLKTIFDMKVINMDEDLTHSIEAICLEKLKLDHLPNLKYVWTKDRNGTNYFQYLQKLRICECNSLRYIFVASTAKGLTRLKKLVIESCGVEAIIVEDETLESDASPCFVFSQLRYLLLRKLPNLKSFFPPRCTYEWPKLRDLLVYQCQNLQVYGSQMTSIKEPAEQDGREPQHPLFLVEKVIPKLKGLLLTQKDVSMIRNGQFQADLFHKVETLHLDSFSDESAISAYGFLERFPNLHELHVHHSSFEEIVPSQPQIVDGMAKTAPFKKLYLGYLDQLKKIWNDDSQLQLAHQDLERLEVECCPSLMKLVPSSASFENLTYLKVSGCHQLIYLVTTSTAKSLVNLNRMEIMDCKRMEEVVTNESEDAKGEIIFKNMFSLKLTGLPSLKRFCPGVLKTRIIWKVILEEDIMYDVEDINKRIELVFLAQDRKNVQESLDH